IRLIADLLAGMGIDVPAWLAEADMREADLADPNGDLSYPTFHKLMVSGLRITQEPAMGLLVGERLRVNTHGMLGYAAMISGTLRQAMELLERFIGVRTTLVSVHHEVRDGENELHFRPTRDLGEI